MKHKAFSFLYTRIGRRFLAMLLIISLLPLLIMRWLAIRNSEAAIAEQTTAVLRSASDAAEAQLREFLDHLEENLLQITRDPRVRNALSMLTRAEGASSISGFAQILRTMVPADVEEVFLLDEHGKLHASSAQKTGFIDCSGADFFNRGAKDFFAGDVLKDSVTSKLRWIMSAPIRDAASHGLLGVAAFRIDLRKLSDLTSGRRILLKGADTQSLRIGDTGETYIVNHSGWMITESRYASDSILKVKVDTLPVRAALNRSQEVTDRYTDYRGTTVSGSSAILHNPAWILITEIDFKQAFAPNSCVFQDNGVGIPKDAQARIFNMFQRLTDDERGNGVGLGVVRKVAEKMRGRVGVESEPGRGSRFWVDLERAAPPNPLT